MCPDLVGAVESTPPSEELPILIQEEDTEEAIPMPEEDTQEVRFHFVKNFFTL